MAIGSGEADQWWGLKVHKVSGGLHTRQQLEKIVNRMVIVKVVGDQMVMKWCMTNMMEVVSNENDRENQCG